MNEKLKAYIQLTRPYAAYLIPSIVLLTAISNSKPSIYEFLLLTLIGLLLHIVLMVQNDYFDVEIDRHSPFVSDRPLVTGVISTREALLLWVSISSVSLLITLLFFSIEAFFSLFSTILLFTLYNRYSKNIPGMEYVLGLAAFTSGLFGAYSVSNRVSLLSLTISLLAMLKYVFNVGVSANMKDLKYDEIFGLKTTPMVFGVRVEDERLYIPPSFLFYAFLLKVVYISVALIPILLGVVSPMVFNLPIPLILISTCSIAILWMILPIFSASNRSKLVTYAGRQELLSYYLLPLAAMSRVVDYSLLVFLLFLFIPPIWIKSSIRLFFKKSLPHE